MNDCPVNCITYFMRRPTPRARQTGHSSPSHSHHLLRLASKGWGFGFGYATYSIKSMLWANNTTTQAYTRPKKNEGQNNNAKSCVHKRSERNTESSCNMRRVWRPHTTKFRERKQSNRAHDDRQPWRRHARLLRIEMFTQQPRLYRTSFKWLTSTTTPPKCFFSQMCCTQQTFLQKNNSIKLNGK